ncbi:MAG: hypothetical protein KJ755_16320 [Alphaproteobacteria bacterium]|jgi:hypothetical protein|nr:hypothetical protein [Alphaproteobacteria bacterium]MBU1606878.1 hypothetical protein [Alphaproteobacteria bacterium]MBU2328891.1 hypothetical protein [Alphaproteobacteria bacterium]
MTKRTKTGQFPKGTSGNPKGKPEGSRNKVTLAAESVLDGEAEKLTRKAIELALAGDGTALRLCIERIMPVRKERRVKFDLGKIEGVSDHPAAQSRIARAVSEGELTPGEGLALTSMLDAQRRSLETADLAERLEQIEERLAGASR